MRLLIILFAFSVFYAPKLIPRANSNSTQFKAGEVIVNYKPEIKYLRIEKIAKELGGKIVYRSQFANFVTISFGKGNDIWNIIRVCESYPEITFAEPNRIVHILWTPNDPYFQFQWNFDDTHINMPLAWDIERGGDSSVIVGILDTGIAYQLNQIPGYEQAEVSSGDGYYHRSPDLSMTNFVQGYDFINNDTLPNDENGHGTHVCGTIAQSTNNAKGVAGMAFNVSIMPVRVLDETGSGTTDQIADGIYYAYQNGANILSMSLGGPAGDSTGFQTVHQAIIDATNAGAVVVAAAGNEGVGQLSYPAVFPECIAVGATDYSNNLAPYSQWGDGIDVVAPGGNLNEPLPGVDTLPAAIVQSTYYQINDGYHKATVDSFTYMFLQGTSMATPHVSALAALIISYGITGQSAVKQTIYSTCTDLGTPGYDTYFGYGLINPSLALGAELLFTSIPVIQNPYSQQYVDIWLVSRKPVMNDLPDTCRVSLGGINTYLYFEKVAEQTYRTDFFFDTSGTATIYVTARDTLGTKGSISKQFTVSEVFGENGGYAQSLDTCFRIDIPACNNNGVNWIVIAEEPMPIDEPTHGFLSKVYSCGPGGKKIQASSRIRLGFDKNFLQHVDFRDIGVYDKKTDNLSYIQTEIDTQNGYAYAEVSEFGSYVIIYSPGSGNSKQYPDKSISVKCYPVPASRKLFFTYTLASNSYVDISLYDISGRKVKEIEKGIMKSKGLYSGSMKVEKNELVSGVYFLKIGLTAGNRRIEENKKIMIMH